MVDVGKVGIEVLLVALTARMTRWAIGGRWSHPFVSFSALIREEMMERSGSAFSALW